MATPIRVADAADAASVAQFFDGIYDSQHGPGSASAWGMVERTAAVLFPERGGPTVLVYDVDGDIQGVVAYQIDPAHGCATIVTVQVRDTVRGRGAAQQLLSETVRACVIAGVSMLSTEVAAADVRARGFLRREGFSVVVEGETAPESEDDATVTYRRLLPAGPAAE